MSQQQGFSLEKKIGSTIDYKIIVITILINLVGLLSIFSATYDSNMGSVFYRQLIAFGIGISLMLTIMYLPARVVKFSSYLVYGASLLLLVAVLTPLGTEVYGTKGWIRFGTFSFQPAEFGKIGLLMLLATHISRKGVDIRNIRDLGIAVLITIVPVFLTVLQPDHGSASVLLILLIGLLFWGGFNTLLLYVVIALPVIILLSLKGMEWFIGGVVIASLGAILLRKRIWVTSIVIGLFILFGYLSPLIYNNLMEHQKARIETFLNPGADPKGTGYNVIQSILAVGSGGTTGKGFLQGTQTQLRYIPMQWTDFIFSVPTEEFGFIGGVAVIGLFFSFIYRAINLAYQFDDKYFSVIGIGIAIIFLYHCLINIGMAIGVMPVMGIPLPFMSYGGTSLIINLMMVGLLLNANRNIKLKRLS